MTLPTLLFLLYLVLWGIAACAIRIQLAMRRAAELDSLYTRQ